MHEFSVWAPFAKRVDVQVDGWLYEMTPGERGWWRRDVEAAIPGTRYGFRLDGGPIRPDPRSRSQPDGVHGLSEVIDPAGFEWTDSRWTGMSARGSVLYELHVGTFTPEGTFDAAIERLDHLVELGVTAVEVMPVAEFPGTRGWGYDGVDLFAPHHSYGGPGGLNRLVNACHERGLGAVLDVVYNHLGPSGNYLREFGPYFSEKHQTNWGDGVNFDGPGSDDVRRFVIDNAKAWLDDYHFD
ncbi:MAG TPA: alpha-amylase family glycosyl hydrolase, partial [Acidimicrobiales bacterium]|nr:alpha-amylase family glycosyl hydrolase [Acidimicrobiales bacterium]